MSARPCGAPSSPTTFQATACSYDACRPMLDRHTLPGRYAQPCTQGRRVVSQVRFQKTSPCWSWTRGHASGQIDGCGDRVQR
jgi:hypothetical protein